jgi:cyclopropane fatty-acyl-phospholipid synthase-like methyltransferase
MGDDNYEKIRENNDKEYSKRRYVWGTKRSEIVEMLSVDLPRKSTVLDLGTAEGRNAIYLAKQGHIVTAVDFSKEGIKKAERRAHMNNVHINTIVTDITDSDFVASLGTYDSILALNVLQFLTPDDSEVALSYIKEKTRPGGFVALSSFRGQHPKYKKFEDFELKNIFNDWKRIHYKESWGTMRCENRRVDTVEIIAQKPWSIIEKRRKEDWAPTGPHPGDD